MEAARKTDDSLKGRNVLLDVDEPYELIAESELTLHGEVVEVVNIQGIDVLHIALTSDESRLYGVRFASANARHHGDSVLSIAAGGWPIRVHGSFFDEDNMLEPKSGFIGRLTLVE